MKKIIAILTALAVVSMAFAQTVSISNTLSTDPMVVIDFGNNQWGFGSDSDYSFLRDRVEGSATTADGRAQVKGRVDFYAKTQSTDGESILNLKPQWHFTTGSGADAVLNPTEAIEFRIIAHGDLINKYFGPSIAWKNNNIGNVSIKGVTGNWENVHRLTNGGYVAFTGVDNLWIGGGLNYGTGGSPDTLAWNGNSTIKKSVFGPFTVGVTYDVEDLFSVGAKYVGQFGGFTGGTNTNGVANQFTEKSFNHHNIYAGFSFNGLKDAKVGTTLGVAVDYNTYKNSAVLATKAYTAFAVSANAGFDFRNGITDNVAVTVGYGQYDGNKSKVPAFYVGNDLGYKVSDDASFSLHTSYAQGALSNSLKTYTEANGTDGDKLLLGYASVITLNPSFSFTMNSSSFSFGVETQVANQLKYNAKTANEWAFTSLYGKKAQVSFPVSWTYNF